MPWLEREIYGYDLRKAARTKSKSNYFIIEGFRNTATVIRQIDSFAAINKPPDINELATYHMYFYKRSRVTNIDHLHKTPKDFDRYSFDDLIYWYVWREGTFVNRYRFKNGVFIEPEPNVEITDVE